MKHSMFSNGRRLGYSASVILLGILFVSLYSCVGKSDKQSSTAFGPPSCMKLTAKEIQANWVDKGFTDPVSVNLIYYIQIYTAYQGPGSDFKVNVQGLRKDYTPVQGSEFDLGPDAACLVSFPTDVAIGSNSMTLSSLNILEADGKLKPTFEKLQLTPQKDPKNPDFLNFTIMAYSSEGTTAPGGETLPCPPCYNCRPPCDSTIDDDSTSLQRKADPVMNK